ncbi:BRO family protein [Turicimonas muris]|uniref:BRO family protein n=3 Tax=Turicimonas muris TaxID=1796652 RepID=UPI001C3ECDCC|nr:BRO family protein [Turicimonas muris]
MSNTLAFSFEGTSFTILGNVLNPLFIAKQICAVLGFGNFRQALSTHVDPDDISKVEIETNGGKQLVNCVNESGLYALIFGSKLPKAKEFKKWVTSEVLPAIRKQGFYSAQKEQDNSLITSEQQYEISSHVMRKTHALFGNRNYSAVYRALKRRFRIPRYTCLLNRDYETALKFIDNLTADDFNLPDMPEEKAPATPVVLAKNAKFVTQACKFSFNAFSTCEKSLAAVPAIPAIPAPVSYSITESEMKAIKAMVYYFDDLFKPLIKWAEKEAFKQNHPLASRFYDVWHEPQWFLGRMKRIIERNNA